MVLRIKILIFWWFTEKSDFRGGIARKRGLEKVADLRGAWQKIGLGGVFEGGGD